MVTRGDKRRSDSDRAESRRSDTRGLGLGAELAAALIGFTLVGLWIDSTFATSPWGTVVCVVLGLIGGFYNFLRSSLRLLRSPVAPGIRRATGGDSTTPGPHREPPSRNRARGDDETPSD